MHDWIASGPGFKNCKKYLIKSAQHYTQQKTNVDNFQEISFYESNHYFIVDFKKET